MPWVYSQLSEIPSVRDYLIEHPSTLYTTMRMPSNSSVIELEMHLERVKATEPEKQTIKEMLKKLQSDHGNKDLRITLIRQAEGFEMIWEEMPRIEIESCQVEIRKAQRHNVQEKNSQWIK